ncbi:HET-domain-containing protein, partial [Leucogyrophana mollusca]
MIRLLNTKTLKLENHINTLEDGALPEYAILSHRWAREEVSYQELNNPSLASKLKGYNKIERCCAHALADGYEYLWVDTCCIDKSSSAELSEAINSMYRWYAQARVCYVYLEDVHSDDNPVAEFSEFRRSKWFTRGWTLQELIAPGTIVFLAMDWVEIGSKTSLISALAVITGVDEGVLLGKVSLAKISVATKMSWASQRNTTRVEDGAYSLMGLFGVHLPLIYGEGNNAFARLQLEILKMSNDQSIFAW